MARYHFNVSDGAVTAGDHEGVELADDQAAVVEAHLVAHSLMGESVAKGRCRRHWRLAVANADGSLAFSLPFALSLEPEQLPAHL